jgi:hypothetical protein
MMSAPAARSAKMFDAMTGSPPSAVANGTGETELLYGYAGDDILRGLGTTPARRATSRCGPRASTRLPATRRAAARCSTRRHAGMRSPRSDTGVGASIVYRRGLVRLRGVSFRDRGPAPQRIGESRWRTSSSISFLSRPRHR